MHGILTTYKERKRGWQSIFTIVFWILVLLVVGFLAKATVSASVSKTYKDDIFHFKIDFTQNYSLKESGTKNSFLRVTAASERSDEFIAIYALKTREDRYSFKKAVNLLLTWAINVDEINKDKFIEYFEKEVVKATTGSIMMDQKLKGGINIIDKEYKIKNTKWKIRYITKNNYAYAIALLTNRSFSQNAQKIVNSFTYSIPILNLWEQLTIIGLGVVVMLIIYAIYYFSGVLFWYIGLLGIWAILKGAIGILYILFIFE